MSLSFYKTSLKLISKHLNSKSMHFFVDCVIFVAMATRRMNLRNVLFLNHEKQELLFMYDDERYLY